MVQETRHSCMESTKTSNRLANVSPPEVSLDTCAKVKTKMSAPMKIKVHSAVLCVLPQNLNVPTSCIGINKDDHHTLFHDKEESGGIIAISRHKQHVQNGDTKVIMSTVTQFEIDNQNKSTRAQKELILWCTKEFLSLNNLKQDQMVYVKHVTTYPLHKVVLGVPSENDTFMYTCSEKFTTDILLSVCQGKLFASKGQKLTIPGNYLPKSGNRVSHSHSNICDEMSLTVLECEPFLHGVITVKTEIILTKLNDQAQDGLHIPTKHLSVPVMISDFTKYTSLEGKVVALQKNTEDCVQATQLQCLVSSKCSQLVSGKQLHEIDISNLVGMSKETMLKCGLFNDSLVSIGVLRDRVDVQLNSKSEAVRNQRRTKYDRVVRVQMIDCPQDCVVMLPSLWFNLTRSSKGKRHASDNMVTVKVLLAILI